MMDHGMSMLNKKEKEGKGEKTGRKKFGIIVWQKN